MAKIGTRALSLAADSMAIRATGLAYESVKYAVAMRLQPGQDSGIRSGGIHAKPQMHCRLAPVLASPVHPAG